MKRTTNTASELGWSAGKNLDHARAETDDALHAAASSVRTTGCQGSTVIDDIAANTANRIDTVAAYIEDWNLRDVLGGSRIFVRQHLTGAPLAAAAIGFLAVGALP